MKGHLPTPVQLPPRMPHLRDGWHRRSCRAVLRLCGWSLVGEFPDVPKAVLIAAPHSSWWDGVWGLLLKVGIGADVHFMGKQELFRGPLGSLLRRLGGMPIDRGAAKGVVEQMIDQFRQHDALWLGIAPEGTRKAVARWKSGFWHIAHDAGVPIVMAYFNYPDKTIGIGPLFKTSNDMDADIGRLRAFYAPFKGKHRNV
ncbi:lysophospholipid acyltransferase family protein [Rhodanobacter sp. C03]|uniref:lysophospholipid acyltransferase family protein n=1 Tax=Rhodanobacter sp. C03 TaxID=1945858 RepID=UPI000984BF26|nr:lysophospholipid acyltransferase family protein [Rhodanobacter sp. C03]OOG59415.1 acyltransferase [Rhodanobacter sp. C03]